MTNPNPKPPLASGRRLLEATQEPWSGHRETHASAVFLAGDRAYKLKKPVSLGFLDFSTRKARQRACRLEVDLNRRLAPDVYLGVADIRGPDGRLCDHLVVMRRLPEAERLDRILGSGARPNDGVRAVARVMARFHGAMEPIRGDQARPASRDGLLRNWQASFDQVAALAEPTLDSGLVVSAEDLAKGYLAGRERLFESRIAAGFIRDGHGDLRADSVYLLEDGPRIVDCLEFDPGLRIGDVLNDVAFLAMDLERLGAAQLGQRFLRWYDEFSGELHPRSLAEHYLAYRAHVRCKVALLRHRQGDPDGADEARHLLLLAHRHLLRCRVRLVLVGGLPGTGKSTLASGVAGSFGWPVLHSDSVRKELAGLPNNAPAPAAFQQGLYAPPASELTYRALLDRAGTALAMGESVVLDATWRDEKWRFAAAELARNLSADLIELVCESPQELAARRIAHRGGAGPGYSDATPAIAAEIAGAFAPWASATEILTSGPAEEALAEATSAINH